MLINVLVRVSDSSSCCCCVS